MALNEISLYAYFRRNRCQGLIGCAFDLCWRHEGRLMMTLEEMKQKKQEYGYSPGDALKAIRCTAKYLEKVILRTDGKPQTGDDRKADCGF